MNIDHPIATITNYILERKRFNFHQDSSNIKSKATFIDTAVTTHREINQCIDQELKEFYENNDIQMHRSYYTHMSNHSLISSQYINANQKFMIDNLKREELTHLENLKHTKKTISLLKHFKSGIVFQFIGEHWQEEVDDGTRTSIRTTSRMKFAQT